ncbi:MAG TPA: lamin tail domain-containing protein, partial [Chloroflexia bacterium]|nr:lamin tail domain-containing protein [Chloroflexia bacterium]
MPLAGSHTRRASLTMGLILGLLALAVARLVLFAPALPTAASHIAGSSGSLPQAPSSTSLVISQVYGGGGNAGAPYQNDFIEVFNPTAAPVVMTSWSVQYASAAGTTWQVTTINGTVPSGGYFLVQEAAGAGCSTLPCGVTLPTPDAIGAIPMSGTAGKVALVSSNTALTGGCPTGGSLIDFVGYGTTASCFEGAGPAPAPSNTTSDLRVGGGCTDNDNNAADFTIANPPTPRNSSSPLNPCQAQATNTPGGPTNTPLPTSTATRTATATATSGPTVRIREIQGLQHLSPYSGTVVSNVPGIVTAKRSNGFYLQDPQPDADNGNSEGIFVFTSSAPAVNVGDQLTVGGRVTEFRTTTLTNLTLTELNSPIISVVSTGNPLPPPIVIGIGGRVPPNMIIEDDATGDVDTSGVFDADTDGIDFYESLEGMLVQVNNAVAVGP